MTSRVCLFVCLLALGCTKQGPGRQPTLTAAEHEAAAARAEKLAAEHQSGQDSTLSGARHCGPIVMPPAQANVAPQSGPSFSRPEDSCGSRTITALREREIEAERQRDAAAEHRSMAWHLRQAEQIACGEVPPQGRVLNPFAPAASIMTVSTVADPGDTGKAALQRAGVRLQLAGPSTLSSSGLERQLNCQAAMAATAHRPELQSSPAAVAGAKSSVWEEDGRLMVEVTSTDRDASQEIERRARALVNRTPR